LKPARTAVPWPFPGGCRPASGYARPARTASAAGRVLTLALTVLVAFALHRALASYADGVHWTRATPDEWITTAALSYAAVGIILHVGIGLRWPFGFDTHTPPS